MQLRPWWHGSVGSVPGRVHMNVTKREREREREREPQRETHSLTHTHIKRERGGEAREGGRKDGVYVCMRWTLLAML